MVAARRARTDVVEDTPAEALEILAALRARPAFLEPEEARSWPTFAALCGRTEATANGIPDAYLAALALADGAALVTADRGLARYPGLVLEHPLEG